MSLISESYKDETGNTRPDVEIALGMFFNMFNDIKVMMNEPKFEMVKEEGVLKGKVTFKPSVIVTSTDKTKGRIPVSNPVTAYITKDSDGKWRFSGATGAASSIKDMMDDAKEF